MKFKSAAGALLAITLLVVTAAATPPASATVLCRTNADPCPGGTYPAGTAVTANLRSFSSTLNAKGSFGTLECRQSTLKGEVSNAGREKEIAAIAIATFTMTGCQGGCSVIVLSEGSLEIHSIGSGNGTATMSGLETTVECKGFHCIYAMSNTDVGTVQGGDAGALSINTSIPRTGGRSGALCESSATWTAEYVVVAPVPLWVVERPVNALCSTATNPCSSSGTYDKGTAIKASLKSGTKTILSTAFGEIKCSESSINGEVTSTNAEAGSITALSFGECNCGVKVLQKGTFSVRNAGGGNGTLTLEGVEITTECLAIHCIWKGADISTSFKGGEMGSVTANAATLERTGGTSGATCGTSGLWTADYTVTAPEPVYAERAPPSGDNLCKTASNPCTGGTYGKGTAVEASLKVNSSLDAALTITCEESSLKGEVTNAGGEGVLVSGSLTSLIFARCGGWTVSVPKAGIFTIESPSEGNGTLRLEGLEITMEGFGLHCIYGGSVPLSLKGGEMAALSLSSSKMARIGGRSGAFCGGTTATWTGEYTVTKPEPLYVEGI